MTKEQLVKPSCKGSQVCVVPNGVDIGYFTPRPDPGGARLLFCGRLDQLANKGAITYFFQFHMASIVWQGEKS
jgi:hypothetical protein